MLTQDQIQVLKAPFPPESLSSDTSRGFELTSIKAAQAPAVIGRAEIATEVALQYRFPATNDCTGCDQVVWNAQANDWAFRNGGSNHDWSEPITDAWKSAVTDGLTKAASMIGVGHQVFKGVVRVESDEAASR